MRTELKQMVWAWLPGAAVAGALILTEALGADSPPSALAQQQPVERSVPAKARRLTPEERRQLLSRLTQPAAEAQRRMTNSAPRKVVGGTDRLAQRLNAALSR